MASSSEWTNSEHLALMQAYLSEIDWDKRSAKLAKQLSAYKSRPKGFYSAKNCECEFSRVTASACPGHEPSLTGDSAPFSKKAIVDAWIEHFRNATSEEHAKSGELLMIDLRRKIELVERLTMNTSRRPVSDREVHTLLEMARKEDEERLRTAKDREQAEQVIQTYMRRLRVVVEDSDKNKPRGRSDARLPATRPAISLRGADSAFRSPSPLTSPIRSISEAIKEANIARAGKNSPQKAVVVEKTKEQVKTPVKEQEETAPAPTSGGKEKRRSKEQRKEVEEVKEEVDDGMEMDQAEEKKKEKEQPVAEEPKKRQKGRPKGSLNKQQSPFPLPAEEVRGGPGRRGSIRLDKDDKRSATPAKDDVVRVGRPPRRSLAADSPSVGGSGRKRREQQGSEAGDTVDEAETGEKRRRESGVAIKEESVSRSAPPSTAPPTPVPAGPQTCFCQTNVSIRCVIGNGGGGGARKSSQPSRRSSRTSTSVSVSETEGGGGGERTRDNGTQTTRVEWTDADEIHIGWSERDHVHHRIVRVADGKEEWSDDDDQALGALVKKTSSTGVSPTVQAAPKEEREKGGGKKDVVITLETDDWLANALLGAGGAWRADEPMPGSTHGSPKKRRDAGGANKEEQAAAKMELMTLWRAVQGHRHSGIFSHPVSDKDAPDYSRTVKSPVDLSSLKKEIELGVVKTRGEVKKKFYLMFANAVMFNSTEHEVNTFAKQMADESMQVFKDRNNKSVLHSRRSKIGAIEEMKPAWQARKHVHSLATFPAPDMNVDGERKVFRRNNTNQVTLRRKV